MSLTVPVEAPLTVVHHPVGASTGFMTDLRGRWDLLVEAAASVSAFAIELAALSESELPELVAFLRRGAPMPFRFVSVHGPTKGLSLSDEQLAERLLAIPLVADVVVMHPDTMSRPDAYARLRRRLALENMDVRKHSGRTVEELQACFAALPLARFCLDVAHARSNDPSMGLAHALLDAFGSRLSHVHVSSLDHSSHVPLTHEDEEAFAPVLERCRDVPWILEAAPPPR